MPFLVPALIAGVAAGAGAAIAGATILGLSVATSALIIGVGTFALSALSALLAPSPPSFSFPQSVRTEVTRSTVQSKRIIYGRSRTGGAAVFFDDSGGNNQFLHIVVAVAGHEIDGFEGIYIGDDFVEHTASGFLTDDKYGSNIRVNYHLGGEDQEADSDLVSESDDWTAAHRLRGDAYAYVRLEFDRTLFPTGIPNMSFLIRGKKVFDPRDATTAWSNNWALTVRDYLTDTVLGLGAPASEMDDDRIATAANACDEDVPLAIGGTEKRYTLNGIIDTADTPLTILTTMVQCGAGKIVYQNGKFNVLAGVFRSASMNLTAADMVGGFRVVTQHSRRDRFNAIKGVFNSPQDNFLDKSFPAIQSATFKAQDNGELITQDVELPLCTSGTQAQRIAKILLLANRQAISLEILTTLKGLAAEVGTVVRLTFDKLGWVAKEFEVTDWSFKPIEGETGVALACQLSLTETTSTIYDFATSEEQAVDPAPNTNLRPFQFMPAPLAVTLSSGDDEVLIAKDGTAISRMRVAITPPNDAFVRQYVVRWKRATDTEFTNSPPFDASSTVTFISPVEDGVEYLVEAQAISALGVPSAFTPAKLVAAGKSQPPPTPASLTVTRLGDGTRRFQWTMPDNLIPNDVRAGGGWRIRYAEGDVATAFADMTQLHDGLLTSTPYETNELAAGTYTFVIRTVDSSDNDSDDRRTVITLGNPPISGAITSRVEEARQWPGTKTDCFVGTDNVLRAAGTSGWSGLPAQWDSLASSWADVASPSASFVYETPVIDLGADLAFTPLVFAEATGTTVKKMRTGSAADGSVTGSYAAVAPTSTPQRYVQFEVTVSRVSGEAPAELRSFTMLLDGDGATEVYTDLDTSSSTDPGFNRIAAGHFEIASKGTLALLRTIRVTFINAGGGFTADVVSKVQTHNGEVAAELKIYNSSGTLADATLDIELDGFLKAE